LKAACQTIKRWDDGDPLRVFATAGFPVLKLNAAKKQFEATREVPSADIQTDEMPARNRPLTP
jgi:hypothetical protein